jgi:hypothetical protein
VGTYFPLLLCTPHRRVVPRSSLCKRRIWCGGGASLSLSTYTPFVPTTRWSFVVLPRCYRVRVEDCLSRLLTSVRPHVGPLFHGPPPPPLRYVLPTPALSSLWRAPPSTFPHRHTHTSPHHTTQLPQLFLVVCRGGLGGGTQDGAVAGHDPLSAELPPPHATCRSVREPPRSYLDVQSCATVHTTHTATRVCARLTSLSQP